MSAAPAMLNWMQVLSDLTRARVLRMLERMELTVGELCDALQAPQSTVSRHLRVLADDDWVASRREGTSRLYRIASPPPNSPRRKLWNLVRDQAIERALSVQDDQRLESVLAERQTRSQAFFSSAAGEWDRLRDELFGRHVNQWVLSAVVSADSIIGELGCGTATFAEIVSPFAERVVAVDHSRAMLKAAGKRLKGCDNVELRRGDLNTLPIDDGELDVAVMILVLPYLTEPALALAEAERVLKPGGRLVVVDMVEHERTEYQQEMGHVWLGFERRQVLDWLEQSGLDQVRHTLIPADTRAKGPPLFAATATSR